jgi:hypothetical protein
MNFCWSTNKSKIIIPLNDAIKNCQVLAEILMLLKQVINIKLKANSDKKNDRIRKKRCKKSRVSATTLIQLGFLAAGALSLISFVSV